MKKVVSFFLVATTIVSFSGMSIFAKSVSELKQEQHEINQTERETRDKLDETTTQKNIAISEMEVLDQELTKATDELEAVETELDNTQKLLEQTRIELEEAIALKELQYETFKQRIKVIYENGDSGYLDVILEAENIVDLMQRVEYVNYIVEYDNDMIEKLTNTENLITQKLEEIEKHEAEVETLVYEQSIKKENLEKKAKEKADLIDSLKKDEATYQIQLDELEASSKTIEDMLKKAQADEERRRSSSSGDDYVPDLDSSVYENGGTFALPVPGRTYISSGYGYRGSPISGKGEFHTGIDIPAPTGTSVVSVEDGVVVSAGWQNGYGYTVVISHGNGFSSLYAHNSRLVVSAGDRVSRGQVISKAGSTGYSTGPHVHFEIRINGKHVNPRKYVNI